MILVQPQPIECRGTPRQRGRQYGEQCREAIFWNAERQAFDSHMQSARKLLAELPDYLRRIAPEVLEEMEGIAEASGLPLPRVLRLNVNQSTDAQWQQCTSMALADGPEGPVLGKNNDSGSTEEARHCFVLRKVYPTSGVPLVQVVHAGALSGLDAMNAEGLATGHNSVGSTLPRRGPRLDIRLRTYQLMSRCRTVPELLKGLAGGPPLTGKGHNIVAVDRAGQTAVIEAAVPLIAWGELGQPFVFATNHYQSSALYDSDQRTPQRKEISIYRLGYLKWIAASAPPRSAADIAEILRSHAPWAPCRHAGPHCSLTEWSMMALPRQGVFRFAPGQPCQHDYTEHQVGV